MAARQMINPKRELNDHALLVNILDLPSSYRKNEEKIRDRLQIYFQRKKHGGGDVDKVVYPLQAKPMKAIVIFSTEAEVDFDKLLQKEVTINLANEVDMIVETSRLPPVFQEVRLVVNPLYMALVPRDKEDKLKKMLLHDAQAILKHSFTDPIINVAVLEHAQAVQDVIFRVAGLQIDEKGTSGTANKTDKQNGYDVDEASQQQEVSTDGSVRPKTRPSEDASYKQHYQLKPSHLSTDHESTDDNRSDSDRMSTEEDDSRDKHKAIQIRDRKSHPQSSRAMAASFADQAAANSGLVDGAEKKGNNVLTNRTDGSTEDTSAESAMSSDQPISCGPFSVSALLFKYLEEKHTKDLNKLRRKYGIEVICKPHKKQGGQGDVNIVCDDKRTTRCSAEELQQAGDEFISLYQSCYQRVTISKAIACNGVGSQKITEVKSIIWTEQQSVMVEYSIDDEVTFVGLEEEVPEAIRTFRKVTGLEPKARKLKNASGPAFAASASPHQGEYHDRTAHSSTDWIPVKTMTKDREFKTAEGIKVIARKDDITKQTVDIIVNASNVYLSHDGGVAAALLRVAGRELQDECNTIRRKDPGSMKVGKCVPTKGYRLPCNHVIHAIGPNYAQTSSEHEFFDQLQKTFLNCFTLANSLKARSIVLPLISSGTFSGRKEVCAKALIGAIQQFSRMEKNNTIDVIVLVNKDNEATDAIITQLSLLHHGEEVEPMDTSEEVASPKVPFWKEPVPAVEMAGTDTSKNLQPNISSQRVVYRTSDVQIVVEQEDILEAAKRADGIIVPTDNMLDLNEGIAKVVAEAAELNKESLKTKINNFKMGDGDIIHTDGCKLGDVKIILVAIPAESRFPSRHQRHDLFEKLQKAIYNCLLYADKILQLRNVALSLFPSEIDVIELSSSAFAQAIHRFVDFGSNSIRQITIVNADDESNMALQVQFADELKPASRGYSPNGANGDFTGQGANAFPDRSRVDQASVSGKTNRYSNTLMNQNQTDTVKDKKTDGDSDESDEEDKKCPICLEDFSASKPPKHLDKCKHRFCKECWDEVMKRKPACSICGVLYGTIKGNQPPGRMDVSHTQYGSLPGYEGCGMITINYSFAGGKQGPNHPEPGNYYSGTSRTAYLPNNANGNRVLNLLRKAFDAGLVFTIGTSVTTGAKNMVTWNDIHHKTSPRGGPQAFGYPDPTYLKRVTEELGAKGIK